MAYRKVQPEFGLTSRQILGLDPASPHKSFANLVPSQHELAKAREYARVLKELHENRENYYRSHGKYPENTRKKKEAEEAEAEATAREAEEEKDAAARHENMLRRMKKNPGELISEELEMLRRLEIQQQQQAYLQQQQLIAQQQAYLQQLIAQQQPYLQQQAQQAYLQQPNIEMNGSNEENEGPAGGAGRGGKRRFHKTKARKQKKRSKTLRKQRK
jgi:hypothetical protein